MPFSFYSVIPSSVSPRGGPHSGGALLTIRGHNLGAAPSGAGYHRYLCRFEQGTHRTHVTATYLPIEGGLVRCTSPLMPEPVNALLTVSVNGQQFSVTTPLDFIMYNTSVVQIDPPYSIFDGGQLINLTVPGVVNFTHVSCKFDGHRPRDMHPIDSIPRDTSSNLALALNDTIGVDRWYGTALVPATIYAPGKLACVTPSAPDAGISRNLTLTFTDPSLARGGIPGVSLVGSARVEHHQWWGGVLELTRAMHHEHGAILISGTPQTGTSPWPWRRFEMRVSVYIGDGEWFCTYDVAKGGKICGGEGWSFSYGAIPSGQLGQLGGGKGLRILFPIQAHATAQRLISPMTMSRCCTRA